MRRLAFTTILLSTAHAVAQPVTVPDHGPCSVTIAHAPDDVRKAIEAWVQSEPRCDKHLEVRVVRTDGGYYLMARDDRGHVRERVVPSVESVAVLVVSWAADDSIDPVPVPLAPVIEPVAIAPSHVPSPPTISPSTPNPPDFALPATELVAVRPQFTRSRAPAWGTLGGITALDGRVGLRGQVDVLSRGAWTLGAAGAWWGPDERSRMRDAQTTATAAVYLSRSAQIGPFEIRAQLGAGAALRDGSMMEEHRNGHSLVPLGEAALSIGVPLTSTWGLAGGPVLDVTPDPDHPATINLFLGLQHRL